jgi:hypothetical protein
MEIHLYSSYSEYAKAKGISRGTKHPWVVPVMKKGSKVGFIDLHALL